MGGAPPRATGGFMPPAWPSIYWLLRASVYLWGALLLAAALRASAQVVLNSNWLRHATRRSRRSWLQRAGVSAAAKWRLGRGYIVRYQQSEPQVARWFGFPRCISGLVVCVLYVVDTYMQGISTLFYFLQALYGAAVAFKLVLSFSYSNRPLLYMFKLSTIIDCLSIPSLIFSSGGQWLNFNFMQAYCVLVQWTILEKHDIVLFNQPAIARLLVNLVLQLITFVYITSCGVQFCELLGDPGSGIAAETFQVTWANSVYLAVVTLMTVGYGDFVPYTLLGRLWIVFHIVFAAYLISREISKLIDALKSLRNGGGSFVKTSSSSFVVVTGHLTWEFLVQFTKEFLMERENLDVKVVVLAFNTTWTDEDWTSFVASSPFYEYHLIFLEGSPLKNEDLDRAKVDSAKAVFVLADPHRSDPYLEDSDTLKALLTVRNYASHVPIYTMNAVRDSSFQFKIAMEQIRPSDTNLFKGGRQSALEASRLYNTFTHLLPPTPGPTSENTPGSSAPIAALPEFGQGPRGEDSTNRIGGVPRDWLTSRSADHGVFSRPGTPVSMRNDTLFRSIDGPLDALGDDVFGSPVHGVHGGVKGNSGQALGESVCMQKLEMALLAESVFCNGLSTLITNFAKQGHAVSQDTDPPWLLEYTLGADCGIQFRKLPRGFAGRRVSEVAVPLFDYGLVLLAVRRSTAHNWRVLTTADILDSDMITAVLTYHEGAVIDKIEDHANMFMENRDYQLRAERATREAEAALSPELSQTGNNVVQDVVGRVHRTEISEATQTVADSLDDSPTQLVERRGALDWEAGAEQASSLMDPSSAQQSEPEGAVGSSSGLSPRPLGVGASPLSAALRLPSSKRSQVPPLEPLPSSIASKASAPKKVSTPRREGKPASSLRSRGSSSEVQKVSSGERRAATGKEMTSSDDEGLRRRREPEGLRIFSSRDRMRWKLEGHVIVCLDSVNSLVSLDYLLKRMHSERIDHGAKESGGKVPVVVIHASFPKNFERELSHHSEYVYLLEGNFLTEETMKQAQFETARSILIMGSDSAACGSTDSKAIFTVMTLDALLARKSNAFLCCLLDAEDSLQLLQPPRLPRRRNISLGEHREVQVRERSFMRGSSSFHLFAQRTMSAGSFAHHSFGSAQFVRTAGSAFDASAHHASMSFGPSSLRRLPRGADSSLGARRVSAVRRSTSTMFADDSDGSDVPAERSSAQNLRNQHWMQQNARDTSENNAPQRFASGEMMISSFFACLLAREFASPGFVQLIRELIGTGAETSQCWIRQLDIPQAWTESANAMDGRTYRETVERLVRAGCIPLGLYRSGDAPVRVACAEDAASADDDDTSPTTRSDDPARAHAGTDVYVSRTLSQLAIDAPLLQGSYLSLHDEFRRLRGNSEDFDEMYYECPTTQRRIRFQEASNGQNILPYVCTNPEAYTIVSASDAVFVLCPPDKALPDMWHEP